MHFIKVINFEKHPNKNRSERILLNLGPLYQIPDSAMLNEVNL